MRRFERVDTESGQYDDSDVGGRDAGGRRALDRRARGRGWRTRLGGAVRFEVDDGTRVTLWLPALSDDGPTASGRSLPADARDGEWFGGEVGAPGTHPTPPVERTD